MVSSNQDKKQMKEEILKQKLSPHDHLIDQRVKRNKEKRRKEMKEEKKKRAMLTPSIKGIKKEKRSYNQ